MRAAAWLASSLTCVQCQLLARFWALIAEAGFASRVGECRLKVNLQESAAPGANTKVTQQHRRSIPCASAISAAQEAGKQ